MLRSEIGKSGLGWRASALAIAMLGLAACDSRPPMPTPTATPPPAPSPTPTAAPTGHLTQATPTGVITLTTENGWKVEIFNRIVTIKPPATVVNGTFQYSSGGAKESLGATDVHNWSMDRRTILLPGGGKVTMSAAGGLLTKVTLYYLNESHEIDTAAQAIRFSQVDASTAASRDNAEADGEAGHLATAQFTLFSTGQSMTAWLYLGNLYTEASAGGARTDAPRALGQQAETGSFAVNEPAFTPPTEADTACGATPVGGLAVNGNGSLTYTTRSGRWRVQLNGIQAVLEYADPVKHKWELWGELHENLNGKHIKEWQSLRRTLILPDGTKITASATSKALGLATTSIYDGARSYRVNAAGNTVLHSCIDATVAAQRDADEADGETGFLALLRSPTSTLGALLALNIYNETGPASPFTRTYDFVPLGLTGEPENNPSLVSDYYDDPDLGNT